MLRAGASVLVEAFYIDSLEELRALVHGHGNVGGADRHLICRSDFYIKVVKELAF